MSRVVISRVSIKEDKRKTIIQVRGGQRMRKRFNIRFREGRK